MESEKTMPETILLGAGGPGGVLPQSHVCLSEGEMAMVRRGPDTWLAVAGELRRRFSGTPDGPWTLCPADHQNRLVLNSLLPWTAPSPLGREGGSFGFGDRLGFANPAQVRSIAKTGLRPVLAQQSLRELQLTGRTLPEVIDCAAWAVFQEGYRKGYACDGDHLKTLPEIQNALSKGATMITLDCSLVLGQPLPEDAVQEASREDGRRYLESADAKSLGLCYTPSLLVELHKVYDAAIRLILEVYRQALAPAGCPIDLEISLDETQETTTPEAHYFVARAVEEAGVPVTSLAPRYVGAFEKAIDYIGDPVRLQEAMEAHARLAERFGYKLSLHSASEKFTALPILAKATGGNYHVKTAGTSWLEVVEVISKRAPNLYRRLHREALAALKDAKRFYAVHCDASRIAPLDSVPDQALPLYLTRNDSRQLLHVTYGAILRQPELRQEILSFLRENRALYEAEAEELYDRHFAALHAAADHQ